MKSILTMTVAEIEALKHLPVGTRVRFYTRPEFGTGTITTVLGDNNYGVKFERIHVSTQGVNTFPPDHKQSRRFAAIREAGIPILYVVE